MMVHDGHSGLILVEHLQVYDQSYHFFYCANQQVPTALMITNAGCYRVVTGLLLMVVAE